MGDKQPPLIRSTLPKSQLQIPAKKYNCPDEIFHTAPKPTLMPHLIDYATELGLGMSTGMGITPITWQELDAWASRTNTPVTDDECRILIDMSKTYCAWSVKAKDKKCEPPFIPQNDTIN